MRIALKLDDTNSANQPLGRSMSNLPCTIKVLHPINTLLRRVHPIELPCFWSQNCSQHNSKLFKTSFCLRRGYVLKRGLSRLYSPKANLNTFKLNLKFKRSFVWKCRWTVKRMLNSLFQVRVYKKFYQQNLNWPNQPLPLPDIANTGLVQPHPLPLPD